MRQLCLVKCWLYLIAGSFLSSNCLCGPADLRVDQESATFMLMNIVDQEFLGGGDINGITCSS